MAAAHDVPRGARRPAADAARARATARGAARPRRRPAAAVEGLGPPLRPPALADRRARRDPRRAPARGGTPGARRRRGRTPRCASSPSTPTRACPSAGSRSPRGTREVRRATTPAASRGPRRLATPRPARVRAGEGGRPEEVDGRAVEAVRESWLVEDRWWIGAPAAPPLLGGRDRRRAQPRRLPRARGRALVRAAVSQ